MDHFTKFYWGLLIKDKTAQTVLKYLKIYIQINKKLKIIQCDNGKEFVNNIIEDYLEKENITIIHSRPRHPKVNGSLERYHAEVHKYYYYDKEKNDINDDILEEALNNYIQYHNKTVKSSTKYSSDEIRNMCDQEIIEVVSNNIIKSMKYHIIDNNEKSEKDDSLLLWINLFINYENILKKII